MTTPKIQFAVLLLLSMNLCIFNNYAGVEAQLAVVSRKNEESTTNAWEIPEDRKRLGLGTPSPPGRSTKRGVSLTGKPVIQYCTAKEINDMDQTVIKKECRCCPYVPSSECGFCPNKFDPTKDCRGSNFLCKECGRYRKVLCESIQNNPKAEVYVTQNNCLAIPANAHMGIEDTSLPKDYWEKAQDLSSSDGKDRAFAMNSKNSREQDQAHIHIGTTDGTTLDKLLKSATTTTYVEVKDLEDGKYDEVWCKADIGNPILDAQKRIVNSAATDRDRIGVFTVEKMTKTAQNKYVQNKWTCVTTGGTAEAFIKETVDCKPRG
mmetsp:Transcript_6140/g.8960  ORF Transcript_6140/g.8960 Transcript_6140/m.8960 type:complete len:320 (-) Transcript_6140:158-1117(-)